MLDQVSLTIHFLRLLRLCFFLYAICLYIYIYSEWIGIFNSTLQV